MNLLLLAALSTLPASEGHHGFGIYDVNPDLTTGDLEFFREVFVSPDAFPTQVDPLESSGDGFGVGNGLGASSCTAPSTAVNDVSSSSSDVGMHP